MLPQEKAELLTLFSDERRWCRNAEACDAGGNPVRFNDIAAVAWDITGALCRLFGWPRARVLFGQIERHVSGGTPSYAHTLDDEIKSMVALQDYNDQAETTFEKLCVKLQSMPVWHGHAQGSASEPSVAHLGGDP